MTLNLQHYFTSPVEAVKVTAENMEEVAAWCGGTVATETNKTTGKEDPYVWVPTPEGSRISWAFKNMWITRRCVISMRGEIKFTYSVFRVDYFRKNYFETVQAAVDATWEKESRQRQNKKRKGKKPAAVKQELRDIDKQAEEAIAGLQETVLRMADILSIPRELITSDAHETMLDAAMRQPAFVEPAETHVHQHAVTETCDENNCPIERYSGPSTVQVFSDKTFKINSEGNAEEIEAQYEKIMRAAGYVFNTRRQLTEEQKEAVMTDTEASVPYSELEGKSEVEVEKSLNGVSEIPSHLTEEPIVTEEDKLEEGEWVHPHNEESDCSISCPPKSNPGLLIFADKQYSVSKYGGRAPIVVDEEDVEGYTPERLKVLMERNNS